MSGKNVNFDNETVLKSDFCKNKKVNRIEDIDTNEMLFSKKETCGTKNSLKYFIEYDDNDIIRPLCIRLPQMTGYARKFDENVTISFRVNNIQLFKKYNKIWEKIKKLLNMNFKSKPVYGNDDKYIKTKIEVYANSIITNFHNKKCLKEKHHANIY